MHDMSIALFITRVRPVKEGLWEPRPQFLEGGSYGDGIGSILQGCWASCQLICGREDTLDTFAVSATEDRDPGKCLFQVPAMRAFCGASAQVSFQEALGGDSVSAESLSAYTAQLLGAPSPFGGSKQLGLRFPVWGGGGQQNSICRRQKGWGRASMD